MTHEIPRIRLSDGTDIPQLGFGMFLVEEGEAERVASDALAAGYRHIDSASIYRNERALGAAIAASGIARDELFVTSKVWTDAHGGDKPRESLLRTLDDLGLDSLDLYLIHWPAPMHGLYVETWHALVELQREGLTRSIGVSNFMVEHLAALADAGGPMPVLNQIEEHPYFRQDEIAAYCREQGIAIEAWSPLGAGRTAALSDPAVLDVAAQVGRTPAQVVLRWHLERRSIVFPKSTNVARMRENLALFDFTLTAGQMSAIDALDRGERVGRHPLERD